MSSLRFQKFVGASCVVTNTRAFEIVRQTLSRSRHAALRCVALRCAALRCGGKRKRPAQLVHDPVGGYVRGRSFMVWVQSPHRLGATHRSPLDVHDAAAHEGRRAVRSVSRSVAGPASGSAISHFYADHAASSGLALEVWTCGRRDRRVPGLRTRVHPERLRSGSWRRRRVRALPIRFQFRQSSASPQGPSFRPALRHGRWRACTSRSARG